MSYFVGQEIEITASVRDVHGALADTSITAELRDPDGNRSMKTVDHPSTGTYKFDFVPDRSGTWWYRWLGTSPIEAAFEGSVDVNPTEFPS